MFLSGSSGDESPSKVTQAVGRVQFHVVAGLRPLFPVGYQWRVVLSF